MKKRSFIDSLVAWVKFAADVIDFIRDKYNEHFKQNDTVQPVQGVATPATLGDENNGANSDGNWYFDPSNSFANENGGR